MMMHITLGKAILPLQQKQKQQQQQLLLLPVLLLVVAGCLSVVVDQAAAGIVLSDAELEVCLHKVQQQLTNVQVPALVEEVFEKANYVGLCGYFLSDIGGPSTNFILEASKMAFIDILERDEYLHACQQFNKQTGQLIYGYECASRTRFQDMMNQRILGLRNLVNKFTRLSNACLFFALAHEDRIVSKFMGDDDDDDF